MDDIGFIQGSFVASILLLLGGFSLLATRNHRDELPFQVFIFLLAFGIRYAFAFVIYQLGLVDVLNDGDASGWIGGVMVYERWGTEDVSLVQVPYLFFSRVFESGDGKNITYIYFLGSLFYLTTMPFRMVASAVNCFAGAMTVVLTYRTGRLLYSKWVARGAALCCCLSPSLITWSAMTLKEPIVIFLESLALYCCISLRSGRLSVRHLVLCFATIAMLLPFRFYAAYIVGLSVLIGLTLPDLFQPQRAVRNILIASALVLAVVFSGLSSQTEKHMDKATLDFIEGFRQNVATGRSNAAVASGVETEDIRTSQGLVKGLVIGGLHLFLAPFPWQLGGGSLRMLLTLPELLVWWWLFFKGFLPGLSYVIRHRLKDSFLPLFFIFAFAFIYSLTFGNVGLVFRQRGQLLPWLLIISMVGLEHRRNLRTIGRGSPGLMNEPMPRPGGPGMPEPRPRDRVIPAPKRLGLREA